MTLLWADPQMRATDGNKRHLYAETDGRLVRRCGERSGKRIHSPKTGNELCREDHADFATDPNACLDCIRVAGLKPYRDKNYSGSNGAESVDYDPFGTFSDGGHDG